jgi:hypothetical protein
MPEPERVWQILYGIIPGVVTIFLLKVNLSDNIYIKQNVGYGLIFSHLFVTRTEYDWIVNLSLGVTFK